MTEQGSGSGSGKQLSVTETCCEKIQVTIATGEVENKQGERQGVYTLTSNNHNNRAEYHQDGGYNIVYYYREEGWYVGADYHTSGIQSQSTAKCPVDQTKWRYSAL